MIQEYSHNSTNWITATGHSDFFRGKWIVQELLDDESYDLAVKNLQLLESRFPFGVYAQQSQLEIIFA